ncbi:DUF3618 domain-containing protein [Cereibacter sp. SYSU M97828]|nr:DUF3618 domain-containing protein [Cereibacter flavus]
MSDNPDRIEAEVEANRAKVESTLDALKDRLSFEGVVNDATRFIGIRDARGTLESAGREVNANPVAFGLIGLGLALLATGATRRSEGYRATSYRPQDGMSRSYVQRDHGPGLASRVREGASQYGGQIRDTASDYTDTAREKLHDAQHALHSGYKRARDRTADLQYRTGQQIDNHPLLIGALAAGVGAVIAAAMPRSDVEDRWIGPGAEHLREEARHVAAEAGERAKAAARAGYAAAVDTAREEGLVPEGGRTLAEKVEHVAQAAVGEAKDTLADKT